ncbi:alpha-L-rhamnosidase N-terminal domain-containing protein [Streptomyces cellulosae]|uniref:alpha-L-rhamnosidase N-terminal domain-containing protein n=1 Tax=Streptomyces cellulosae TaxID=1968 RepID=UPI0004CC520E
MTYTDGSATSLVTDKDWLTADGPTTFDQVYSGEKDDARRADELEEWRSAGHRAARAGQLLRTVPRVPRHACRGDYPRRPSAAHSGLVQDRVDDLSHLVPALMTADRAVLSLPGRDDRPDQLPRLQVALAPAPRTARTVAAADHAG